MLRVDKKKILQEYLLYELESKKTQEQIKKLTTGNVIQQIPIKSIEKILISQLPIAEQRKIIKKYSKLRTEINDLQEKLERKRKELREALEE